MKFLHVILMLIIGLLIVSVSVSGPNTFQNAEIMTMYCDSTPQLNKKVIEFVNANLKKKVGKGECWDLAAGALNSVGAKWNGAYVFGSVISYKTECVYPGDIMQFMDVKIQYEVDDRTFIETMDQHTAIIYKVEAMGDYVIAHQNTAFSGRKVGLSSLNLKNITKGRFTIYRPVK